MGGRPIESERSSEEWNVGGPSTNRMAANGSEKATLKPGDVVTTMATSSPMVRRFFACRRS